MEALESLLDDRENMTKIGFDPKDHRIRCYAHIINICSSHIVASTTPTSKSYLSDLKVPLDTNHTTLDNSDSEADSDDDDFSFDCGINESHLAEFFGDQRDSTTKRWLSGIQRDPVRRARKLVNFLRASDQRKEGLRKAIQDGNKSNKFIGKDDKGKPIVVKLPELELLRDVKTRWDSVYMMLERLRPLRPVRFFLSFPSLMLN
jgi:hypothetical protein